MTTARFARVLKIDVNKPNNPLMPIDNLFESFTDYKKALPTGSPPNTPEAIPMRLTHHFPSLRLEEKNKAFEIDKMKFEEALQVRKKDIEQPQEYIKEFEPTCLTFK